MISAGFRPIASAAGPHPVHLRRDVLAFEFASMMLQRCATAAGLEIEFVGELGRRRGRAPLTSPAENDWRAWMLPGFGQRRRVEQLKTVANEGITLSDGGFP
jgi:hypothetical protein